MENKLEQFIKDFVDIEICNSKLKIEFNERVDKMDFSRIFEVYFEDAGKYRNSVVIQNHRNYHCLGPVTDKNVREVTYKYFMKDFVEKISKDLNEQFYFEEIQKRSNGKSKSFLSKFLKYF